MKQMKRFWILSAAVFTLPIFGYGQSQSKETIKGRNEFELSITPQYFLNKLNVHNDGALPEAITARNRMGVNFGIDYYRITRSGLIYGAGVSYGVISHALTKGVKDLSFFYPQKDNEGFVRYLSRRDAADFEIYNLQYASVHPSLGYRFKPQEDFLEGWSFQVIAGCDFLLYINGDKSNYAIISSYTDNTGGILYQNKPILNISSQFGTPSYQQQKMYLLYSLDFELARSVDWKIIHSVNIGIKLTCSGTNYKSNASDKSGFSAVDAYEYNSNTPISHNEYRARDLSIGLKFGIGLW